MPECSVKSVDEKILMGKNLESKGEQGYTMTFMNKTCYEIYS